ncbi:hypothetical protein BZG36_03372 [Bifiguratus adelaidae]|uniref:Charged multivesicular body protein 3 n=1 Tax=Bifiguratus adelaidae TaxID=1938954 RepID=A0A261XXL4_9FUNG|nr:hypothetical protein BZG36_03372 [Bifiguratus adelaidae]
MQTYESIQRFFGKKTPEELVKKWRQEIRQQERGLEKQIRFIEVEESKVKKTLKQCAARNDAKTCKLLAKELVRSRKHKERLYTSKAQLSSINMQLNHQLATLKIAGTLQKSSEVMKLVNNLVRLPEVSRAMQQLSMELTKAGIMDEMVQDTLESLDDEEVEEEADAEVDKVLYEVTNGMLGEAGAVGAPLEQPEVEEEEEETEKMDVMKQRLEALKG